MTNKEKLILEDRFNIYECENGEIELETWTNGGVNMFIYLDTTSEETITQQFRNYFDNFDIDEEIDIHRQGEDYKDRFTITESVEDFENYVDWLRFVLMELESDLTDIHYLCNKYATDTLKNVYVKNFNVNNDMLELMDMVTSALLEKFLIGIFEKEFSFDELKEELNNMLGDV